MKNKKVDEVLNFTFKYLKKILNEEIVDKEEIINQPAKIAENESKWSTRQDTESSSTGKTEETKE